MAYGATRTLAGTGEPGFDGDGDGSTTRLNEPFGVVLAPDGAVWFTDLNNHRICRSDVATGLVETRVGCGELGNDGDGGPALAARIFEPYELRFDAVGNLFFVDMKAHVVRRVDAETGIISTLAGSGAPGFSGDEGPGTSARFAQPHSIELDGDDNLLIADIGNHRIRRLDLATGVITTFAGNGGTGPVAYGSHISETDLHGPRAIAFAASGDMVIALREGNCVVRVDAATGIIRHVAGTGEFGWSGDGGDARQALLAGPKGLALGPAGAIFIADTESHTVRRIDGDTNVITTVLGDGTKHDGPDGDPLRCGLARPHGVFVDTAANIYVGDTENHRLRMISPA